MSYQEALGLAGSYINDVIVCDDCRRPRGNFRCPCSYELPVPVVVPAVRRYAVKPVDGSHLIPYASEMYARSFAEGHGGTVLDLEEDRVIASYPVPTDKLKAYAEGNRQAALIISGRGHSRRWAA